MNRDNAADVLTTALEGGIGYWSAASKIERDDDLRVHSVELSDANANELVEPDFDPTVVTSEKVATTIRELSTATSKPAYMSERTFKIARGLAHASGEYAEDILCDIDADDADQIVQMAVLGRIVFG